MKILLSAFFILTSFLLKAQNSGEFTVPFSNPTGAVKVIVDIKTGSVTVKGTARKDVWVKYSDKEENEPETVEDNNNDNDNDHRNRTTNKEGLKKISNGTMNLEASEYQNTVKINSDNWGNRMNVIVEVPSTVSLKVKTYNDGDLEVNNITGIVELTNYNGAITATGISGTVVAETYNGDIKIVYDKLTPDTPLSYANFNGNIDLTFPASLKANVKMKTKQGEIYSGFDAQVKKGSPVTKTETKTGIYKVQIDDWVKVDVNGGGPEVSIQTYNGDIFLRKK
ncbi:MAG: hypothetical protein OJF59_003262 [Cytophagales bacterium]|jgi:DUF4097 and DUF4098 domain-containing protein YvlB|nr:MAG: hypothetical protein OJF59_003262 [Cytophagales bacterium]